MPYKFLPTGHLDVATDPALLPEASSGPHNAVSGAMTRCTNLRLERTGIAETRRGSSKLSETAVSGGINSIVEHGGDRYLFTDDGAIHQNLSSIATGLTANAPWEAVVYNAFNVTTQSVFATNGTDKKRIEGSSVYEWGISAPTTAPTVVGTIQHAYNYAWELSNGHATGPARRFTQQYSTTHEYLYDWESDQLDGGGVAADTDTRRTTYWFESSGSGVYGGKYSVKYTYVRKSGSTVECESNPSPAASINTESAVGVTWTASSDSQVTHVRVYRTLVGGSTYYYAAEVAVGTTSIGLSELDSTLGAEVADDHDRLPDNVVALAGPDFNGYLWAITGNRLHYCKAKQPEYWPSAYYLEIGPPQWPCRAVALHNGQTFVFTDHEIHQIQGTGFASFFPYKLPSLAGALAARSVLAVQGHGIYHLSSDGLYLFGGAADNRITDVRFRPTFDGITVGSLPGVSLSNLSRSILLQHRGKLWVGYPSSTYVDEWLVQDFVEQRTTHHDYNAAVFRAACIDRSEDRILAADADGYVWHLDDEDQTDDGGTEISWQIETKVFGDPARRQFPRQARYDVELVGSAATAVGRVLLDEAVVQSHTLGSRETRFRLITSANGNRLALRVDGTGDVKIRQAEVS
jgi:hypothetical protein